MIGGFWAPPFVNYLKKWTGRPPEPQNPFLSKSGSPWLAFSTVLRVGSLLVLWGTMAVCGGWWQHEETHCGPCHALASGGLGNGRAQETWKIKENDVYITSGLGSKFCRFQKILTPPEGSEQYAKSIWP